MRTTAANHSNPKRLSLTPPDRNDPCYCGSNKKYKKCCLLKEHQYISYHVQSTPLTEEEAQNSFPEPSEEDIEILNTSYNMLQSPKNLRAHHTHILEQLYTLRDKYPENPVILNHISVIYSILDMKNERKQLIKEMYQRFPDYLFAKMGQAEILLDNDEFEEAFLVLDQAHSLKHIHPNRRVFHITEFKPFELCLIRYFCGILDLKQAQLHLQILRKVVGNDDEAVHDAKKLIAKTEILIELTALAKTAQKTD